MLDVTLIGTGLMVSVALDAAKLLAGEGISARVVNAASIKPIDEADVIAAAAETGAIVTAEEHHIRGGLGSAVAEVVTANRPCPVLRVGVEDRFGKSGKVPVLLEEFGLTAANIADKARKAISMK